MDILIVRHAIAHDRDSGRWPDDSARPLTDRGRERFIAAARGLRHLAPAVEVLYTSPYVRAASTAESLTEQAGWPEATTLDSLRADAAPADVVRSLQGQEAQFVALVGHEPQLSRVTSLLISGDEVGVDLLFKKGGAALLTVPGNLPRPGAAALRWLLAPETLRALGK